MSGEQDSLAQQVEAYCRWRGNSTSVTPGTLGTCTHRVGFDAVGVLGYSKRITERLTAHASQASEGMFLNVRLGNVQGSRGSVLTALSAQLVAGGPITVTRPGSPATA
jgi:Polysaccharide biosynthesis protein